MNIPTERLSVRKLRHSIRKRTYRALLLTGGAPGMDQAQQIQVVTQQITYLEEALERAKTLLQVVTERDFTAHKAAKDAAATTPAPEKMAEGEEKSMSDLTFQEIIAGLEEKQAEQPKGDVPPF
jgi:enoyl-CoA hydratase/carnithine racemase